MSTASFPPLTKAVAITASLLLCSAPLAGGPIGPGVISLPPIVAKYDEHCLDRIDKKDEKLAARQSRECRKPKGSRNGLPVAANNETLKPK